MSRLTESVRIAYQAFGESTETPWDVFDDDVVFHISGDHPLSGDYVGIAEVRRYLTAVREATGGRSGFSVVSVITDETGAELLVEGTVLHGEGPDVRTMVHLLRLVDGRVVEFRDHPFDPKAENQFWSARVPVQRDGTGTRAGANPVSSRAVIPTQASTHPTSD